jgi:tRNA threonylcarbamoyladenosine biosynthesis protein TsaB
MVVNNDSFKETLINNKICFFGNGAEKWRGLCEHKNACFITVKNEGAALAALSSKMLYNQSFSDVAYASPLYLKEFFSEGRHSI